LPPAVPLKDGEYFTRTRKRIRDALTEVENSARIDKMVADLLDAA
jgi:hypothetical protein